MWHIRNASPISFCALRQNVTYNAAQRKITTTVYDRLVMGIFVSLKSLTDKKVFIGMTASTVENLSEFLRRSKNDHKTTKLVLKYVHIFMEIFRTKYS